MNARMPLINSGTRWKIRSARYLAKSHIPRPLRRQAVHLSYYNGGNFGDALSPLVTEFALGAPVVESHFAGADLSAIGSILDPLQRWGNRLNPIVWGSGFIQEGGRWKGRSIRPVAVRGVLTRERVQHLAEPRIPLGDPGLLVRRIFPEFLDVQKRYRVSLIPHISESFDPIVAELRQQDPGLHVINVRSDPRRVLEEIAASGVVFSSSLHGLVCSDALGVPNAWTPLSAKLEGREYKFIDYYSAFGRAPNPLIAAEALDAADEVESRWDAPRNLDLLLDDLLRAFPQEALLSLYRR